jgi:hypothetical protein
MVSLPPLPQPFRIETDVAETEWIDQRLDQSRSSPPTVGFIVPSGFESYARLLHPGRRYLGESHEERTLLRWREIADVRGKMIHPEVELHALIDNADEWDYHHWKAISVGGGEWSPPDEALHDTEALPLLSILRSATSAGDGWFMLWNGYGDLRRRGFETVPWGTIHRLDGDPPDVPAELLGSVWAYRHYYVFRGPLAGLSTWFEWRPEAPNYFWPDDKAWIVATEIDGFSTYVGAPRHQIEEILMSPFFEALPCELGHRFDGIGDPINGEPWD